MERFGHWRVAMVLLLTMVAFSCSLAAEFKKLKAKDMKLDGSLCSLPRSSAFGLGMAAIICLSLAQVVGTSAAALGSLRSTNKSNNNDNTTRVVSIVLLVLSWVTFALAITLLATASSMNIGQYYGKGWMDGECYIVHNGVFAGAAALVIVTVVFILWFMYVTQPAVASMSRSSIHYCTSLDSEGRDHQHKEPPSMV
ncbi:protein MODIFYING WALL LIGNIN-1-like [Typha angustifolia]|uniref:protein MODIFYING WALL LIGNIN-1-like n=1 Tax=Typha angustifolia TaxID=59011 RepID=UPI003C2D77F4